MIPIIHKNEIAVWKVLKKYLPIMTNNGKIAVGVSGGPDSVALLSIVNDLVIRHKLEIKISVAHFNHGQRGEESDQDAEFVRNLAEKLGLDFYMEEMPSKGQCSEEALRALKILLF